MKIRTCTSILAFFLLALATQPLSRAQGAGATASGNYQFSLADGYTRVVDFTAQTQANGSATGQLFLSDEVEIFNQDVDGTGDPNLRGSTRGFYLRVEFDSLVVNQNQAVMSGTIRESSIAGFVGQRVLMAVEDNGDNTRVADRMTWGIYQPVTRGWEIGDAERREDEGVGMTWTASDGERRDDVGVTMPRAKAKGFENLPVTSDSFVDVERGAGDILVRP